MKNLFLAVMIGLFTTGAFAHSKVSKTVPANGAEISVVPQDIEFTFAKKMRLTKVDLTHLDHPTVALDLSAIKGFAKDFTVPLQGMGDGTYRIEWRGLGTDGHAMKGEFTFEVN